jgi:hypothetical protein
MSIGARFSTSLKLSLLASLGLVPVACGGSTLEGGGGMAGEGGSGPNGGKGGKGGTGEGGTGTGAASAGTSGAGVGGARGGEGGSGTGAGGSNVGGTGVGGTPTCSSPVKDDTTGLVTCEEGYQHRPVARECAVAPSAPSGGAGGEATDVPAPPPRATGTVPCAGDATVCDAFELGYCRAGGNAAPVCLSGCRVDADCGSGSLCHCLPGSKHGGECVPTDCRTDADCDAGWLCASGRGHCGDVAFGCFKPTDECSSNADCSPGGACVLSGGARTCFSGACGRPFLVEHAARRAPVARRGDWRDGSAPAVDHLDAEERAALAGHWASLGQMEHASIAAFARFQLQLLALGAPAHLVEACNRALLDETLHARLCFGLASTYAGRPLGPGPLDVSHSLDVTSLADIVDLVLLEGCLGETGAALEALEAAESAADEVVRGVYARIAEDEQRHAELAFRFVRWALASGGGEVRARIGAFLDSALVESHPARAVAIPCLEALLSRGEAQADWPHVSLEGGTSFQL